MLTGGGFVFRRILAGSTETKPLVVGNHSRPSRPRQAPGCEPIVHSRVGNPSGRPKNRMFKDVRPPAATGSIDVFKTRINPALEPIQR